MSSPRVLLRVLCAAALLASCGPGKSTKGLDSVVLSSSAVSVAQGGTVALTATVAASSEPAGTIELALSGAPAGLTLSPSSVAFSGSSQALTTSLVATDVTATGVYPLKLTASMGSAAVTAALTVTVTPGLGTLTVSVLLPASITLTPAVSVLNAQGTSVATISAAGDKSLPNLPAGTYTVSATAVVADGITYTPTVSGSPAVVQVNDTAMAGVDYGATSGALSVTVTAPAGVTPSLSLANAGGTVLQTIKVTGVTTVPSLAPGSYTLTAQTVAFSGATYAPTITGSPATVAEGQTADASVAYTLVPPTTGNLDVTVTGPAGLIPSVTVSDSMGVVVQTITMRDLTAVNDLAPGVYTIAAASVGDQNIRYDGSVAGSPATITVGETTMASVTYAPGPLLVAAPTTLSLFIPGEPQDITVTESGYAGTFTEAGTCTGVATIAVVSPGVYAVTPLATGMCAFTFTDDFLQTASVMVGVTTSSPIVLGGTTEDLTVPTNPNYQQQTLYFGALGETSTFSVTESGYSGTFTPTLDPVTCGTGATVVATVAAGTGGVFNVTAANAGLCRLTIGDSNGQTQLVWISVTTATFTITGISPGASQLVVNLVGVTAQLPGYITPTFLTLNISFAGSMPGCTVTAGVGTCAGLVVTGGAQPIGYAFQARNPSGAVLGRRDPAAYSLVEGTANTGVSATLQGVVSTVTVSGPTLFAGAPIDETLTVAVRDASGQLIAGTADYYDPITLTDEDVSGVTTIAVGGSAAAAGSIVVSAPTDVVTLDYDGAATPPIVISASGMGLSGGGTISSSYQPIAAAEISGAGGLQTDQVTSDGSPADANINELTLYLPAVGAAATLSLSDAGVNNGQGFQVPLTLSTGSCGTGAGAMAAVTSVEGTSGENFTITAQAAGLCELSFSDGLGQTTDVWVSVTTASEPVYGVSLAGASLTVSVAAFSSPTGLSEAPSWLPTTTTIPLSWTGPDANCFTQPTGLPYCNVTVPAAEGTVSFTYSVADGLNALLDVGSEANDVFSQGESNTASGPTLGAVVAAIDVEPPAGQPKLAAGTPATFGLSVAATDAAGLAIPAAQPYAGPVQFTLASGAGAAGLTINSGTFASAAQQGSQGDALTLDYSGFAAPPPGLEIVVSGTGVQSGLTASLVLPITDAPITLPVTLPTDQSGTDGQGDTNGHPTDPNYQAATLFFTSPGEMQTLAPAETGYTTGSYDGQFTLSFGTACGSGSGAVATASPAAGAASSFAFTANAPGVCPVTFTDGNGQTLVVWLSVTFAYYTFDNISPNATQLLVSVDSYNGITSGVPQFPSWLQAPIANPEAIAISAGGASPNCTAAVPGGPLTCILPVPAPPGAVNYTFSAETTAGTLLGQKSGSGTWLEGTQAGSVTGGTEQSIHGIVSTVIVTGGPLIAGAPGVYPLTVAAFDPSGASIVGPTTYLNAIALTSGGSLPNVSLEVNDPAATSGTAIVTVNAPTDTVGIVYQGAAYTGSFAITASGSAPAGSITGGGTIAAETLPPITTTSTIVAGTTDSAAADADFGQATIFFSSIGATAPLTVTEAGFVGAPYDGQITATLDPTTCGSGTGAVATVALTTPGNPAAGGSFTVTSLNVGICRLQLADTLGQAKTVWISVTTASLSLGNVSPSATQLKVTVTAVDAGSVPAWVQQPATLTLVVSGPSANCTVSGGVENCTGLIIPAAAPNTTYTVTALDSSNTALNVLTNASFPISQGTQNPLAATFPTLASTVTVANTTLTADDSGSFAVAVSVADADENVISGPLTNPITVTDSDTSGITLLAVNGGTPAASVVMNNGSDTVTIVYTGEAFVGPFTLTATGAAPLVSGSGTISETLPAISLPATTTDGPATGGSVGDANYNQPTLYFVSPLAPAQTLNVIELGWTDQGQQFTGSLDPATCGTGAAAVATVSASPATTFTVTPQNIGLCRLSLVNGLAQTQVVWISVSSTTLSVAGVSPNGISLMATVVSYNGATSGFPSWIPRSTDYSLSFSGATPNCDNQGGAGTCAIAFPAPPGNAVYTLSVIASNGSLVDTLASASFSVTQGTSNALTTNLQGVVSTVTFPNPPTLIANVPSTQTLTVTALDGSGAPIVGTTPYYVAIDLYQGSNVSDGSVYYLTVVEEPSGATESGELTNPVTVYSPADIVSLVYTGEAFPQAFSINTGSASGPDEIGGSVTFRPPAKYPITLSPSLTTDDAGDGGLSTDANFNQPTLFFSGTSAAPQTIAMAELGWSNSPYDQGFSPSLDTGTCNKDGKWVATMTSGPATSFTVTPQNPGLCLVTILDQLGDTQTFWISVTAAQLTLAGVSPSATQVSVVVNSVNAGGLPSWVSQPSPTALVVGTNCTEGASETCTLDIPTSATAASYTFTVSDGTNALGTVTASYPILQGQLNSLTAILEGIVGGVQVANTSLTVGTSTTAALAVTALDVDGNPIVASSAGPVEYVNPITLTDTDTTGATTLSVVHGTYSAEVSGGSNSVTVEGTADAVSIVYTGQAFATFDLTTAASAPFTSSFGTVTPLDLQPITVTKSITDAALTGGLATDPNFNQPTYFFTSPFDVTKSITAAETYWSTTPYDKSFTTLLDPSTCGSGASAVASIVANSATKFTITPQNIGICQLSVLDGAGQSKVVWISVSGSSLTLHSVPSATAQLAITIEGVNGLDPGNSGFPTWLGDSPQAVLAIPGPGVSCTAPSGGVETCTVTALPTVFGDVEYYIEADDVNIEFLGSVDQTLDGLKQGDLNTGLSLTISGG